MERRLSTRKPVDVSVYLFLKVNPLQVPKNKRLNLMFALHLNASNLVRLRRVSAIAIRSEQSGVGMKFC
jgi:hypothetical protein